MTPTFMKLWRLFLLALGLGGLLLSIHWSGAQAVRAALPAGFRQETVATSLEQPTAMAFAPDGRLFVTEKTGAIRVIKNGVLRNKPYKTLNVSTESERGLLGIAFDPEFPTRPFVYVYYTTGPGAKNYSGSPKNRVARLKGTGDIATKKEKILLDNIPSDAGNHNGGDIHFGPDSKLYIAVGDGGQYHTDSQKLNNLRGKILRLNKDGTIPADNPYVGQGSKRGEIWAYGLRNPWRFTLRPSNNALFIADVGQNTWEEIDLGKATGNYGWPDWEGPCPGSAPNCTPNPDNYPDNLEYPRHYYKHSVGHSITGGEFVTGSNYPAPYEGGYFYGDYVAGWIKVLTFDASNNVTAETDFDTVNGPVDFLLGPDGNIYVIALNDGAIYTYTYIP